MTELVHKSTQPRVPPSAGLRKTVPPAPARDARDARGERGRLLNAARADVTLVQKRKSQIAEAFYDIGKALTRLKCEPIPKLLGYRSFGLLCRKEFAISPATATKLTQIVDRMSPRDARRWGKEKAAALVDLANASGAGARISRSTLPFDPESMTTRQIRERAKQLRATATVGRRRGRHVTTSETGLATKLEAALHTAGISATRVRAVAGRPGQSATLSIDRVPIGRLSALRKGLSTFLGA